jgi:uncharacterized LabA/DUF88 family protein
MLTQEPQCRVWQKPVYSKALSYASLAISAIGIILNNLAIAAIPLLLITLLLYLHLQQTFEPSTSKLNKNVASEVSTFIPQLPTSSQRGRVAIFIDAENLYFCSKEAGVKIRYAQLLKELTQSASGIIGAYYYTSVNQTNLNHCRFVETLQSIGYEIIPNQFQEKNRDSAIIVDMMRYQDLFDTVVLVSGDGDFCNPVHFLKESHHRVEVVSFPANTNQNLREIATEYIDILSLHNVSQKVIDFKHS